MNDTYCQLIAQTAFLYIYIERFSTIFSILHTHLFLSYYSFTVMTSLHSYYQLLGIADQASVDEIKKAFRVKAKQYHPDNNPSADAKQQFIQIHEAYEVLLHHKTNLSYNTVKEKYQRSKTSEDEILRAAKTRAETFASNSYKSYKNTGYYTKSKQVKEATYFVELMFYFVVVIILPIILSFFIGVKYAFFAAIGIIVITMPDWIRMIASAPAISWDGIKEGLSLLSWPKVTIHWILLPISCIIYLTIGFQTFITLDEISILYAICYAISIIILFVVKKYSVAKSIFSSFSFAFAALNFILFLNYFISYGSHSETYSYGSTSVRMAPRHRRVWNAYRKVQYGKGSIIRLLNSQGFDTYDDYMSIRFFWIYDDIPNDYFNQITYTTKEGLFNYKIYTERTFTAIPERNL